MPDLPIIGQSPEEKAFEAAVAHLLPEPLQEDKAFVKMLQVWFEEGWDAAWDAADPQGQFA